jgi:hypothetical protein
MFCKLVGEIDAESRNSFNDMSSPFLDNWGASFCKMRASSLVILQT